MGFQVSPGVAVKEVDLTTIVPSVSTTDGAFAGVFRWGPLEEIVLVGDENQLVADFGAPDDDTFVSFFTAANFLAYGNKLRLVRCADTITYQDFEFTATAVGTTLETSASMRAGNCFVRPGDVVTFNGEERDIVSVENSSEVVLNRSFTTSPSHQTVILKNYKGCLNATAEDVTGTGTPGIGALIKNDGDYQENFSNGLADVGPFCAKYAGALGNSLIVSMCPGTLAYKNPQITGSVSTTVNSTIVSGVYTGQDLQASPPVQGTLSTKFTEELAVGSIIKDLATGQERKVLAISNDGTLTVDTPFSPTLSAAKLSAKWQYADAIGIQPDTSNYAQTKGAFEDELHVVVVDGDGKFSGTKGTILERHSFLSKAYDAKTEDGSSSYYANVLNRRSKFIRWTDHLIDGQNWGLKAEDVKPGNFNSPKKPYTVQLRGGADANNKLDNPGVDAGQIKGYGLFKNPELVDISLVMLGDAETNVVIDVINNICEARKDCIAFISPPRDAVIDNAGNEATDTIAYRNTLPSTSYAVMDSGWKYQYDKYNDKTRWVPLNGDIAGLCVRTDVEQDPWWSPAGYNRGNIKNVLKLAYSPFKGERDDLYLAGINPVVSQQGQGTILFGDKTLLSKPSAFDRINVRRLFIVLEKSIAKMSKYMLFEFNDEFTRQQFRSMVEPYLRDVQSRRGIYDFRVVCDKTNNTGEVIDRNEFRGDIYIKPARSINFIELKFVAVRTGVEFSEVVGKV